MSTTHLPTAKRLHIGNNGPHQVDLYEDDEELRCLRRTYLDTSKPLTLVFLHKNKWGLATEQYYVKTMTPKQARDEFGAEDVDALLG